MSERMMKTKGTVITAASVKAWEGCGSDAFPMYKGSFEFQEEVHWKRPVAPERILVTDPENGEIRIEILPAPGQDSGQVPASEPGQASGQVSEPAPPNRFYLELPADPGEHFYGCGETFSEFDLAGQKVRLWVAEHQNEKRIERKLAKIAAGTYDPESSEPFDCYESYYAQPTFTSSAGYAVHVDTSAYVEFDFTTPGKIGIEMRERAPVYILRPDDAEQPESGEQLRRAEQECAEPGPDFPALSTLMAKRFGTVPPLPSWANDGMIFGIQQGPEVIEEKLRKLAEHGVKVAGVWSQDWCGCRRTAFGYQVMWNWRADEELYHDLPAYIRKWKAEGIHFLGYINTFMAIEKDLYRYAHEHGYCVKDQNGEDYLVTITTFPAAMIDLTNPEAFAWYKEVIRTNMIGIGMDGWMADFAEYLPVDAVLYSGEDAKLVHNRWPGLWAKLNREAIEEAGKLGEVFFFTRAGSEETIRYSTMMWTGDQHVDWSLDDGLASVIPATLSLAMSGYGLAHSDVGGYTTKDGMHRSKELLMRWAEMCAFSPLMRSHEGNQPWSNVQFDADGELLDHLARCVQMHLKLKPYLDRLMGEEAEKGIPVMRPLFYHYHEERAYTEKYEYLLGRDILVAPVTKEGVAEWRCYLPADRWVHLPTGTIYDMTEKCEKTGSDDTPADGMVTVPAPVGMPPVFLRASAPMADELLWEHW